MKITASWLRSWGDYPFDESQLAEQLTLAGLETDLLPTKTTSFSGVIIGKITKVTAHPNADRLNLCKVDCGASHTPKMIICGASNVREGLLVATALIGAALPGGLAIQPRVIRKIESEGMLCSLAELGLQEIFSREATFSGIWELPEGMPLGVDLWEHLELEESTLHIQVPPNRGDCLSVMGIARELSALNQISFTIPEIPSVATTHQASLSVHVDYPPACPRYTGRTICNINPLAKTPYWIVKRLWQGGIRSINAVVDITNYILLEWGAPLHAFDLDQLSGPLSIRLGQSGETLHLLNDKTIEIQSDTLVIADQKGPTTIAGIMGGLSSRVTDKTTNIFLESAFFTTEAIMGRARQYGLMTESSYRFERGVDPELCQNALALASNLLLTICGGELGPVVTVEHPETLPTTHPITLHHNHVHKVLGIELPPRSITEQLTCLGMKNATHPETGITPTDTPLGDTVWYLNSPSWRFDITESVDLIEELARLSGYDSIPEKLPALPLHFQKETPERKGLTKWRRWLANQGYHEVINYSFTSENDQKALEPDTTPVQLTNPISSELNVLRTQLWPGLLRTVRYHQSYRSEPYGCFENGTVFTQETQGIIERNHVGGVITGDFLKAQWGTTSREFDFFDLKQLVHNSLEQLDPQGGYTYATALHPALHPGQSSMLCRENEIIGWLGALHPRLYEYFELTAPVYLFEWQLQKLLSTDIQCFKHFSRFPYMRRDIAFWISKDIPFDAVKALIIKSAGEYLQGLTLFDVYQAENHAHQRSFALSLIWQHPQKTLTDEEANHWQGKVIQSLQEVWSIQLRNG